MYVYTKQKLEVSSEKNTKANVFSGSEMLLDLPNLGEHRAFDFLQGNNAECLGGLAVTHYIL